MEFELELDDIIEVIEDRCDELIDDEEAEYLMAELDVVAIQETAALGSTIDEQTLRAHEQLWFQLKTYHGYEEN